MHCVRRRTVAALEVLHVARPLHDLALCAREHEARIVKGEDDAVTVHVPGCGY